MQDAAHLRDASGPSPVRTRSSTPLMMSSDRVSEMPAGFTPGQTSAHLPHRVQASSMSSTRSPRAVSKEISLIGYLSSLQPMRKLPTPLPHLYLESLAHKRGGVNGKPQPR